jgi:hypothetical protein
MGFAGYVSFCVQLYCVGFHCFTACFGLHGHLHVCRIFIFICLKDSASLPFLRGHNMHVFHLCFVLALFSFVNFVVSLRVCLLALSLLFVCLSTKITKENSTGTKHKWKTCRVVTT